MPSARGLNDQNTLDIYRLKSLTGSLTTADEAMTYAGKIAAGVPVQTDWNTYTQLRAMAVSDQSDNSSNSNRAASLRFSLIRPSRITQPPVPYCDAVL